MRRLLSLPEDGVSDRPDAQDEFVLSCPIPISDYPVVTLAHGGGGRLLPQLIDRMFGPAFDNPVLREGHDGATLPTDGRRLAFTTDSFVVSPIFFPGGDIGTLAVDGTVNDLSMCGARPLYMSAGMILEEGMPMDGLWRVVQSMKAAAEEADVLLVTGDTKVVDRGKGDGVYINTSGIGVMEHDLEIGPTRVAPGDAVVLSGDIGRHGIAVMAVREGLAFESSIESDCAPLWEPVAAMLNAGVTPHCLRDLTRGGLASSLVEIAGQANVHVRIDERVIPVRQDVEGACEILGLDPMYVANEGRFVAFVPGDQAQAALEAIRSCPVGEQACVIGNVRDDDRDLVTLTSSIGATRVVDMLSGEQLPRIC